LYQVPKMDGDYSIMVQKLNAGYRIRVQKWMLNIILESKT